MKKYIVGEALKQERVKLGLTQKAFIQDTLSISQYSRIESGIQDIKISDLIHILTINNIDIKDFFLSISINSSSYSQNIIDNEKVMLQLMQGFYNHDSQSLKELKKNITYYDPKNCLLNLIELVIAVLEKRTELLPENVFQFFSDELNKSDNWISDKNFLNLLGNTMTIINIDRLNTYMKRILKTYKSNISSYPLIIQKRIAGICINYLKRSSTSKNVELVNETCLLINNLSPVPELLMFKLLGLYFQNIFTNNQDKNEEILKLLSKCGYSSFIKNLF